MCWVTNPRGRLEERMDMNFRSLRVEPATRKNFAPYGVLVGVDPAVDSRTGEFYGDKVELWAPGRSEEHTSELQSLMRISYAVFCLKKTTTPSMLFTNDTPTSLA